MCANGFLSVSLREFTPALGEGVLRVPGSSVRFSSHRLFWTTCDHVTDRVQQHQRTEEGRQGATARARIRGFWWPVAQEAPLGVMRNMVTITPGALDRGTPDTWGFQEERGGLPKDDASHPTGADSVLVPVPGMGVPGAMGNEDVLNKMLMHFIYSFTYLTLKATFSFFQHLFSNYNTGNPESNA